MQDAAMALARRGAVREDRGFETPCLIWWGGKTTDGYGETFVDGRVVYAHRIAFELHIGPIPPGHDIHHRCEQRACIEPTHLQPRDHAEHAATKLTRADAARIRQLYATGRWTQARLGALFDIRRAYVSEIIHHKYWPDRPRPMPAVQNRS